MKGIMNVSIFEPSFGGSTSAKVYFENGVCCSFVDTSTHLTNYTWDTWNNYNPVGKTIEEVEQDLDNWFKDWNDEFRIPGIYYSLYKEEEETV